jgi:thiamine-phosphate pyrophosphorylase
VLLCYVTDRTQFAGDEAARRESLLNAIARAARAGVDYIQLREKDLPGAALERLARAAQARLAGERARLLLNSRVDVALAAGAAGVHLPSGPEELSPGEARILFTQAGVARPIISVACHSRAASADPRRRGADLILFGPVFAKGARPNPEGLAELRAVCAATKAPVLAIGGVTAENAARCREAGAAGIAGIRLFQTDESEPAATVARLRSLWP